MSPLVWTPLLLFASLVGGRMPPCPPALPVSMCKIPRAKEQARRQRVLLGEASVGCSLLYTLAAPCPTSANPGSQLPGGSGAHSLLFSLWLAHSSRVEWDSPWDVIGCHRWHLRPVLKNKPQCNALGFLNSCASAETRESAKLSEGEQGLGGGRFPGAPAGWAMPGAQGSELAGEQGRGRGPVGAPGVGVRREHLLGGRRARGPEPLGGGASGRGTRSCAGCQRAGVAPTEPCGT